MTSARPRKTLLDDGVDDGVDAMVIFPAEKYLSSYSDMSRGEDHLISLCMFTAYQFEGKGSTESTDYDNGEERG
jgi:hypothetical protein